MRKHTLCAVLATLALSACAGTPSQPVSSKCFNARGDLTCDLRPLPELWGEARRDAVRQVGVYEGAVEDGPYAQR
ncbi:hypothetical protein [Paracoccus gahaiensis]|uniref:hypothetical protein n=1 Tax=Paracoccus gahaiensis TaxID=1706839 RepID=UPI00145D1F59|nr:hypothetical protein [Paracoccus gahaiensis]